MDKLLGTSPFEQKNLTIEPELGKIAGMRHFNKDGLLRAARDHIAMVREKIVGLLPNYKAQIKHTETTFYRLSPEQQLAANVILGTLHQKTHDLGLLYPSPYFIKCIVRFDTEAADRIFYFSKLPFAEENIYSWTTPAAVLRFTDPGKFEYTGGDQTPVKGTLKHKEQYLITDGRLVFMAAEAVEHPRELIYQEHFSKRKTEFTLPEIVEQMEAAQDKAIRTPPTHSLLISGPAGSGKTTLALHRIAYLLQAPDTAERFTADKTIVFVNDHTTRQYFAQLLPELGITNVAITTFSDFCLSHLNLYEFGYTAHSHIDTSLRNLYEYQKQQALTAIPPMYRGSIFELLTNLYAPYLTGDTIKLWKAQQTTKQLDRFDLTLLLASHLHTHKGLFTSETEYIQQKGGKVARKTKKAPLQYSLLLLDEVQNYLPKQIELLKTLLTPSGSMIYVGDLAQQTKLFTVRQWDQVGEQFTDDNTVALQKVYRSTKQILEYIAAQGYPVQTPENAREGEGVTIYQYNDIASRDEYLDRIIREHPDVTTGILAPNIDTLQQFAQKYKDNPKVKILSISEAQGVEFDVVALCDIQELLNTDLTNYPEPLKPQVAQVNRDLAYVGLTRTMNELYLLSQG
jgi:DNA helicase IV